VSNRERHANFGCTVDWRVAEFDPSYPGAWQTDGTQWTADGGDTESFSLSGVTDKPWIQAAVRFATTGSTTGVVDVLVAAKK